jgi:hypothetical protein
VRKLLIYPTPIQRFRLTFSTSVRWFETRRSKVQILSPRPLSPLFSLAYSLRCCRGSSMVPFAD